MRMIEFGDLRVGVPNTGRLPHAGNTLVRDKLEPLDYWAW